MEIGGLEFQHLVDAFLVNLIGSFANFLWCAICTTKAGLNQLLAVLVQQIERVQVRAGRDLDQLCKTIPDLCSRKRSEKGEVQEGVHRSMIGAKSVFVVTVVDGDFDRYRSVDQTYDSSRDSDEVSVPAIGRTGEAVAKIGQQLNTSKFNILGD